MKLEIELEDEKDLLRLHGVSLDERDEAIAKLIAGWRITEKKLGKLAALVNTIRVSFSSLSYRILRMDITISVFCFDKERIDISFGELPLGKFSENFSREYEIDLLANTLAERIIGAVTDHHTAIDLSLHRFFAKIPSVISNEGTSPEQKSFQENVSCLTPRPEEKPEASS